MARRPNDTHSELVKGTVARIVADRGFCFIKDFNGQDYFCHMSALTNVQMSELHPGDQVTFTPTTGPKGLRAEAVSLT